MALPWRCLSPEPLSDLTGVLELPHSARLCEAARIASPRARTAKEVHDEELRFLERFRGKRSERFVYLSKIFGRHQTMKKFKEYLGTGELNA